MDIINLGHTPISEAAPAGNDVRYEPTFEALSQEIAKLGSPTASAGIDLKAVVDLSCQILETESKHLQVASYLSFGLMKTQGMDGLAAGVHVLKEVTENYWDTLFPPKKRMKGRRGIIEWWEEKTAEFLVAADAVTWDKENRDSLIKDLTALDGFLGENMPDAPLLRPLINKAKSAINEVATAPEPVPQPPAPEPVAQTPVDPQPEPVAPPSEPPPQAPAEQHVQPPVAPQPEPATTGDLDSQGILKQGLDLLGKAATALRKENTFNPTVYRINRIVAWIQIKDLPKASSGNTLVEPPNKTALTAIDTLYTESKWADLINACESKVRQYPFWLDLSRYVCESMEQLGKNEVAQAIEAETALFVSRLSGIETLSFSNGIPFADAPTLEWLRQSLQRGGEETADPVTADGVQQFITQASGEALGLIKDKKPGQALSLLNEGLKRSPSLREKFLWKTALCRTLIRTKKISIAASYIDDLLNDIETYHLDAWEPEIAVDAYTLALTGLRLQKNPALEPQIESVVKKVCVLDPVTALKIV